MSGATVYKNMTLLEGEALTLRENAYLVVDDGLVVETGTGWTGEGVDLAHTLVFPAFVDAHTHLADHAIKDIAVGLPTPEAVSPPDGVKYQYLNRLTAGELSNALGDAIEELLRCGIVACGDFREGGLEGVDALKHAAAEYPFLPIVFGDATVLPSADGYDEQLASVFCSADGAGVGDVSRFSNDQIDALGSRCGYPEKRLAVHAAETQDAQLACLAEWGESEVYRILKAEPELLVHLTCPRPGDLSAIAESGAAVVCCARTNAILGDGLPPVADFLSHGIPVALGTDNLMFTSPDMFREMDWVSRLARGQRKQADAVASIDVLQAATLGGARALGLENELGTLEPGKAACFVGVDLESMNLRGVRDAHAALVHRAGLQDVSRVVAWGREVYRGGER